mmetsp:Transcript_22587/g.59667  ORF Transcript_22587/g.59667 Transcript_22587/m.59667 type:complete len:529 (-) Transcript_22587:39-1625(-)
MASRFPVDRVDLMADGAAEGEGEGEGAAAGEGEGDSSMADMKAMLAAKGYDIVGDVEELSGSDDEDFMPGRIKTLEPNLAKEKGNKAFKEGKYDKAIRHWQGGLKSILSSLCSGPQALGNQSLSELDLTLNLNIAMAYMKKGDYEGADRSVDKALCRRDALPPQQVTKALYRKASAQKAMHRLEECLATLKDLLEVESTNAAAKQMQQEVKQEWNLQKEKQKKNMRKMWAKLEDGDKEEEEKQLQAREEARKRCAVKWTEDDVPSEAFSQGDAPPAEGKDWGLSLTRSVLWSIEQFAVEGSWCLEPAAVKGCLSLWFLGASSTCELRHLIPAPLLERLPGMKALDMTLVGFLGELDPDNKRVPDARADQLPKKPIMTELNGQMVCLRTIQGTLEEALGREAEEGGLAAPAGGEVEPPSVCFIAHPQLHRYFGEFFPAVSWLIERKVPTVIIGASEPDPSWKQDEILLRAMGANIVVSKRESPYPMCLPDNPDVRKCNHIIGFLGGKPMDKDKLTKVKLDLLAQDYSVR